MASALLLLTLFALLQRTAGLERVVAWREGLWEGLDTSNWRGFLWFFLSQLLQPFFHC